MQNTPTMNTRLSDQLFLPGLDPVQARKLTDHMPQYMAMEGNTFVNQNLGTLSSSVLQASLAIHRLTNLIEEQQKRLEAIVANIDAGVLLMDEQGTVLYANQHGSQIHRLLCECEQDAKSCALHNILVSMNQNGNQRSDKRIEKTGMTFHVKASRIQERSKSDKFSVFIYPIDQMESGLAQNWIMAPLVKELVAALAHEINNPLTPIISLTNDSWEHDARDVSRKSLKIIHSAGERIATVIRQLLQFDQVYHEGKIRPIDLNKSLKKIILQMRTEFIKSSLKVRYRLSTKLPKIVGNEAQLQQMLYYLLHGIKSSPDAAESTILINTYAKDGEAHIRILMRHVELPYYIAMLQSKKTYKSVDEFRDIPIIFADLLSRLNDMRLKFSRIEPHQSEILISIKTLES